MEILSIESEMRELGTIQIDMDGFRILLNNQGYNIAGSSDDYIFNRETVFEFLKLFDTYGVKATFFVVGRDLKVPEKRLILKDIVEKGHEIANHTMNHVMGFGCLSRSEKDYEINECERIMEDTLGGQTRRIPCPEF